MSEYVRVFVGLGSNINPRENLRKAIEAIQVRYCTVIVSPIYQSKSVGFEGADFLNAVVSFETRLSAHAMAKDLKTLEQDLGRTVNEVGMSNRHIDLDLLLYGDLVDEAIKVPRYDVTHYDFVLKPLVDLYPNGVHPVQGHTYSTLWADKKRSMALVSVHL